MANIHGIGAELQNAMRPAVAGHRITISNGTRTTKTINASSPPIGQEILTETGLDLSEHDRVFFFKKEDLAGFTLTRGCVVTDLSDWSTWKLLPQGQGAEHWWRWHDQNRKSIKITCKMMNIP